MSNCMHESSENQIKLRELSTPLIKAEKKINGDNFIILFFSFILFLMVWSIIVIGKFYSLHSNVFDLGFIMQRLWQPYNVLTPYFATYILFSSGIQYVLSPLYFLHSFQALLLFQVLAIGVSCFPLYSISKKKLKSTEFALMISIAYLIYFPSSGILWFDVHFQAFFIPLFIFAYYFYINDHYYVATLLFVLSGTTRFPYMIFPFIFSIFELIDHKVSIKIGTQLSPKKKSLLILFFTTAVFLAAGSYFDFFVPQPSIIQTANTPLIVRLLLLGLTLIFILGPLLFIPILKFKWFVMAIPLFALGLYSGNPNYTYPLVMKLQYTSMVVPIIFLGLIESLAQPSDPVSRIKGSNRPSLMTKFSQYILKIRKKVVKKRRSFIVSILLLLIVGSVFYQPYSPVNIIDGIVYHPSQDVNFNTSNYNILMSLIHLIPPNNPYVIFQNDMPELLPRPPADNLPFLFSTYLSTNVTLSDVYNNMFPILNTFGQAEFTKIDYLIAYTQSPQYYLQFNSKESTLPQLLSLMISSGKYGIVGEDMGFILVERNYSKPPKLYEPLILNIPFNLTNPSVGDTFHDLSTFRESSTFVTLVPGNYTITYYISVTNNSNAAHIYGALGYSFGNVLSQFFNVSAEYFKSVNTITAVPFNISVPNQESNTFFIISASNFVGNVTVYKVSLVQTSY